MKHLKAIRRYGTIVLALIFFGLWQKSERQQSQALEIAAATIETTRACVSSYGVAVDLIGRSAFDRMTSLRVEATSSSPSPK